RPPGIRRTRSGAVPVRHVRAGPTCLPRTRRGPSPRDTPADPPAHRGCRSRPLATSCGVRRTPDGDSLRDPLPFEHVAMLQDVLHVAGRDTVALEEAAYLVEQTLDAAVERL